MSGISGNPPVFDYTAEHVGTMFGEFYGIPGPAADLARRVPGRAAGCVPGHRVARARQRSSSSARRNRRSRTPCCRRRHESSRGVHRDLAWPIAAATRRFLALPASARHAWLAAHLTALRAGTITLAQIP